MSTLYGFKTKYLCTHYKCVMVWVTLAIMVKILIYWIKPIFFLRKLLVISWHEGSRDMGVSQEFGERVREFTVDFNEPWETGCDYY